MSTLETSSIGSVATQCESEPAQESVPVREGSISGFDGGRRPLLKEPSLYVSLVIIFIVAAVSLNKTPSVFWLSFGSMSVLAIAFHVLAERWLFKTTKEFDHFVAPLEGIFVVTLGAIVPGIGLLAYGIYAASTSPLTNCFDEVGKLALLLAVPIFNFAVWSAIRKGYLIRPRLIGLMSGLACGLSALWTVVWLKTVFFGGGVAPCKFGWMLLLCSAPFLLFSAACLNRDLWFKTEPSMKRITAAFSVLGGLLSFVFVFAPMVRALGIQSLLNDARQSQSATQARAIAGLRSLATPEDLRASNTPVTGFALAELLLPCRGLDSSSDADKALYFKITGHPYPEAKNDVPKLNTTVGTKIAGLSLAKSQISGNIDASTLCSSIDWTCTFHNSNSSSAEARAEFSLPKGAVVSRVTLWVNGEPREAAFAGNSVTKAAYDSVVARQRDPLLVTMSTPDRILVQCFPVLGGGGDAKIRLGFKVPLNLIDSKSCTLELPKLLSSNFIEPKRHRISLTSRDLASGGIAGLVAEKNVEGYVLNGIARSTITPIVVQRSVPVSGFATPDWYVRGQYIVQQIKEVSTPAPKRLFVVLDSSAALKNVAPQLKLALSNIPSSINTSVFFAPEEVEKNELDSPVAQVVPMTRDQAVATLISDRFVGGQDNGPGLREALETAAETSGSAVLWIHGPQPVGQNQPESAPLDLVHNVGLYDLQIQPGPSALFQSIKSEDACGLITTVSVHHESVPKDVQQLVSTWTKPAKTLSITRELSKTVPPGMIIADRLVSAQTTSLWAQEQIAKLLANGEKEQAREAASKYRLVTPVSGAVVLASAQEYSAWQLNPGNYKDGQVISAIVAGVRAANSDINGTYRGMHQWFNDDVVGNLGRQLVGAPVDPRFGQSNEVGQLADFGYDTARDISRILTVVSFLISLVVAGLFLRSKKSITRSAQAKAVLLVLVVPFIVHLLGTFIINNFGGLGGGL